MKFANAETSSRTAELGVELGLDASSGYPVPLRFRQLAGRPRPADLRPAADDPDQTVGW